jgi:hypothetical protein
MDAPTRDVAIAQLKARGITTTSVKAEAGSEDIVVPALPGGPAPAPAKGRPAGSSLRDRLFYIGVALGFGALGIGAACLGPVLDYDCRRDASGVVSCHIERRVLRLVPLSPVDATHILSASTRQGTYSETMTEHAENIRRGRSAQSHVTLTLICTTGPCWTSDSSNPLGDTNASIESGINRLLALSEPEEFKAWQAEEVALWVAGAFQIPLAIILFTGMLRLLFFRDWDEQKGREFAERMSRVADKIRRSGV